MGAKQEMNLKAGVITGDDVLKVPSPFPSIRLSNFKLFQYARQHQFAIPAIVSLPLTFGD